jgi:hypothetical protein
MQKLWRYISLAAATAILPIVVLWIRHGMEIWTKRAKPIETTDPLFGTVVTEMQEGLWIGLLDYDAYIVGVVPIVFMLLAIVVFAERKFRAAKNV